MYRTKVKQVDGIEVGGSAHIQEVVEEQITEQTKELKIKTFDGQFQSQDLNDLRDKLNEVINHINNE